MKNRKPLKEKISITADGDLLEKRKQKAEYECRPLFQYINLILKRFAESEEKKQ